MHLHEGDLFQTQKGSYSSFKKYPAPLGKYGKKNSISQISYTTNQPQLLQPPDF